MAVALLRILHGYRCSYELGSLMEQRNMITNIKLFGIILIIFSCGCVTQRIPSNYVHIDVEKDISISSVLVISYHGDRDKSPPELELRCDTNICKPQELYERKICNITVIEMRQCIATLNNDGMLRGICNDILYIGYDKIYGITVRRDTNEYFVNIGFGKEAINVLNKIYAVMKSEEAKSQIKKIVEYIKWKS